MITQKIVMVAFSLTNKKIATFQQSKSALERGIMLDLLSGVEKNTHISQRDLGIAIGLANAYLKRVITKGWVRATQIPTRRLVYYLTPRGFAEKTQLTTQHLAGSFAFFRNARGQCLDLLTFCEKNRWLKVVLVGEGELAR